MPRGGKFTRENAVSSGIAARRRYHPVLDSVRSKKRGPVDLVGDLGAEE
jgi:hypothetical protein